MHVRNVRWARSIGLGVFVACATLAATASAAFAWSYTADVTPGSVGAGTSTMFTVTLTNTSGSNPLNSAKIAPPDGFTLTGASPGSGENGTLVVNPNKVVLTGLGLAPGQSASVNVTATAPCPSDTYDWGTAAFSKGIGSMQLDLDTADSSVTTDVTGSCGLEFLTEPNNALTNTKITGNSYDKTGPPVTVQVLDANGVPTTSSDWVTVALGTDTSADNDGANLSGNLSKNAPNGVATFQNLRLDQSNNNYTLVASGASSTSTESSPFDIGDGVTNCNTSMDCMLTLHGSASTLAIDAGPNNGQLVGQVDPGIPMDGPGSDPRTDPGCADYTPQNPDWYGFSVINTVDEETGPAKTLTWTVQDATPTGYMVCFGATSPFEAVTLGGDVIPSEPGMLPDGTPPANEDDEIQGGYVGFLPLCSQLGDASDREPCINSLTPRGGNLIVVVTIPADFAGDPFMGRG